MIPSGLIGHRLYRPGRKWYLYLDLGRGPPKTPNTEAVMRTPAAKRVEQNNAVTQKVAAPKVREFEPAQVSFSAMFGFERVRVLGRIKCREQG